MRRAPSSRVHPSGVKKFRVQYFIEGKRKTISIGTYGAITLAEARTEYNKISEKHRTAQ